MKIITLENLNQFWINIKKEMDKIRVIHKSTSAPSDSDGKDGDIWIMYEGD